MKALILGFTHGDDIDLKASTTLAMIYCFISLSYVKLQV